MWRITTNLSTYLLNSLEIDIALITIESQLFVAERCKLLLFINSMKYFPNCSPISAVL